MAANNSCGKIILFSTSVIVIGVIMGNVIEVIAEDIRVSFK